MNKIKQIFIVLVGLVLLTACSGGSSKLDSVVYELNDIPGTTSTITFEYDKDGNIQTATTKSLAIYAESGQPKEVYEEMNAAAAAMYDAMDGVKHTVDITDDQMTETLEITVKDVSKESLPVLFATAVEDGKVSLETYTKNLETVGYTKK